ncbi:mechanosensitive ion channel family protein [Polyangium sp. y55x31]|uniref:mechanosensitive ion channel domain-containing protein n=1 Tax=Polyangium sp. y55x31 TaxID=3042688 RepID=UPI0024822937|nr:mechanosensitive ion channel family protein [Polyangium sp. y55x31]MDI1483397.1 mechanosensitive ion channel family protein [Polyangium sp. y55x31]
MHPRSPLRGILLALMCLALPIGAHAAPDASALAPGAESASAAASTPAPEPATAPASAAAPAPVAPSASASAAPPVAEGVPVRLRDTRLFSIRVPRAGESPEERARAASMALRAAAESGEHAAVRVERRGDDALVIVSDKTIVTFGPEDAAASGEASVAALAEDVAGRVRVALAKEQSRSAALLTLLSVALVVLSGMVALFFARKIGQLADRASAFLEQHPERIPAIRLQSIEVVRPESFRAAMLIATKAARVLFRLGIAYGWVLIGLSLFEPTRGYAERLSGFVFGPLYSLLARLIGSLPLLVVAVIAAIALIVLVRFVGLFFDGVARGQTTLDWLPADLAAPTSILVRAAVVIAFFLVAAPLVGADDGALVRAGTAVIAALALSATPVVASAAAGIVVVYGRRLSVGDHAEIGGRAGRVRAVSLLEVELEGEDGTFRIPHLYSLVRPTRLLGPEPPVSVEVTLEKTTLDEEVRDLLREAAGAVGSRPRVELVRLDAEGACYRVTAHRAGAGASSELVVLLVEALSAAEIPLAKAGVRVVPTSSRAARA